MPASDLKRVARKIDSTFYMTDICERMVHYINAHTLVLNPCSNLLQVLNELLLPSCGLAGFEDVAMKLNTNLKLRPPRPPEEGNHWTQKVM